MNDPADKALDEKTKAHNHDTWRHINRVRFYLHICVDSLLRRALKHDMSKLVEPEASAFAYIEYDMEKLSYADEQYDDSVERLTKEGALAHHYAVNDHHPEHFARGVEDMTIMQISEMICDWIAGSERQNDGNIRQSIEIACERHKIHGQLKKVIENTVIELLSKRDG